MKVYLLSILFVLALSFISCRKAALTEETASIALNACLQKTYDGDRINLCFDEVVEDSRCPVFAVCAWQGLARVKFTMTLNEKPYSFVLATSNLPNSKTDVAIQQYKITLLNVVPYPGDSPAGKPAVEVRITKR